MEIIPGLHRMEIPIPDNPLGHLNVYAIQDDDGWAIVDTGFNHDEAYERLVSQITELAGGMSNIRRVIITHWHPDHIGLARRVKAASGAKLLMHETDVDSLNRILSGGGMRSTTVSDWLILSGMPREEVASIPPPSIARNFGGEQLFVPDISLHGGERLRIGRFTFEVILTPGHSPGHICLHEPNERILMSGDHILPVITPSVTYRPQIGGNPLASFLSSLRQLKELDISLVLPAHEQPFSGLRRRVEEIEKHHKVRCDEILTALDGSPKTAYDIGFAVTWAEGQMQWEDMPHFHRMLALEEIGAHLCFMRLEGILEMTTENGRELWTKIAG